MSSSTTSTARAPYDALGAEASRSTYVQGRAVQAACTRLAGHLIDAAANRWGVPADQLTVAGGSVRTADGTRQLAFTELAAELREVVAEATYQPEDRDPLPVVSADFCEVEVDRWTGVVRVISFVAAQDIGRVINLLGAEGQIEGGIHHGLGFALTEGLEYEAGQPLNGNFVGYRVLMATDMPAVTPILVERQDPEGGPFGAKGIGTGVIPAIAPAAANAIRDALGIRPLRTPITPARIVEMLDDLPDADPVLG
jgi:CO/xanthine dehydrogenase Mo-binding subunit